MSRTLRIELTPSFPVVPGANEIVQVTASGISPIPAISEGSRIAHSEGPRSWMTSTCSP